MPALEVDPEEPGQGMAPSRSILARTYNQAYHNLSSGCWGRCQGGQGLSDDSDDGDSDSMWNEGSCLGVATGATGILR